MEAMDSRATDLQAIGDLSEQARAAIITRITNDLAAPVGTVLFERVDGKNSQRQFFSEDSADLVLTVDFGGRELSVEMSAAREANHVRLHLPGVKAFLIDLLEFKVPGSHPYNEIARLSKEVVNLLPAKAGAYRPWG
jgi:hypothetical protein